MTMYQAFSSLPSLLLDSFFESIGESYVTKNYCPASLRSIFSKISEKLVHGRPTSRNFDYLKKYDFFLILKVLSGLLVELKSF